MTRKCGARRRAPRFMLENARHGARDARSSTGLALVLTRLIGVLGALAAPLLDLASPGRTKGNACAPGLREADGDRLFRRSRPMLASANFSDLFANEFAGLRRGRLPRAFVLTCFIDRSLVWHDHSPIRPGDLVHRGASLHSSMSYQRAREPNRSSLGEQHEPACTRVRKALSASHAGHRCMICECLAHRGRVDGEATIRMPTS
jgi:hypothetical protein